MKGYDRIEGVTMRSAADYARRQGFPTRFTSKLDIHGLLRLLEQDVPTIPSITKFGSGISGTRIPHVVVLRGNIEEYLLINDPADMRRRKVSWSEFLRRWHEQDHETLIIYPKSW